MVRLIFWTPNQLQIVVEKHKIEAKADFPEIPMYFQAFVKETNRFLKRKGAALSLTVFFLKKQTAEVFDGLEAFSAVFLETISTYVTPKSYELYFIFGPKSIRLV